MKRRHGLVRLALIWVGVACGFSLTAALAATPGPAPAPAPDQQGIVNTVELLAYGVLVPSRVKPALPQTIEHPRGDRVDGVRFGSNSARITAEPNTSFGIAYKVDGAFKAASIDTVCVVIFPKGGLTTPDGQVFERSTETVTIEPGKPVIYGYGFDEEWELIPGEWVFQVWYGNTRLLQKTFTVLSATEDTDATATELIQPVD